MQLPVMLQKYREAHLLFSTFAFNAYLQNRRDKEVPKLPIHASSGVTRFLINIGEWINSNMATKTFRKFSHEIRTLRAVERELHVQKKVMPAWHNITANDNMHL